MTNRTVMSGLAVTLCAWMAYAAPAAAQDWPSVPVATPAAGADDGQSASGSQPPSVPLSGLGTPRLLPLLEDAPPHNAWRDLFSGTWGDVRRFPSRQTVNWLVIGAAVAAGTRPADSHVGRSLSTATQLREVSEPGAFIGSTPLQLGLSAAAYAIGRSTDSPRLAAVGADLFRAQLLAQGLTMGMKSTFRRRRPEGAGFAFPSGHTTVSFASATVLQQHFGWRLGAPAYALASYVALSRVQMKRHYLSDVAFGAALGIAAGRTITFGRERRMHLGPMVAGGGAGVQFAWYGRR